MFVARILDGITAGNLSLAQAYIADVTVPEKRAQSFGIIGIAFGVGFTIGPGISGELARISYVAPDPGRVCAFPDQYSLYGFLLPAKPPLPEGVAPEEVQKAPRNALSIFHPGYVPRLHAATRASGICSLSSFVSRSRSRYSSPVSLFSLRRVSTTDPRRSVTFCWSLEFLEF